MCSYICVSNRYRRFPLKLTQRDGWSSQRDNTLRKYLIEYYGRCQACGMVSRPTRNSSFLECAHIHGKDPETGMYHNSPYNLLILCPNDHTLLDNGLPEDAYHVAARVQRRYPCLTYTWSEEQRIPWYRPLPCVWPA